MPRVGVLDRILRDDDDDDDDPGREQRAGVPNQVVALAAPPESAERKEIKKLKKQLVISGARNKRVTKQAKKKVSSVAEKVEEAASSSSSISGLLDIRVAGNDDAALNTYGNIVDIASDYKNKFDRNSRALMCKKFVMHGYSRGQLKSVRKQVDDFKGKATAGSSRRPLLCIKRSFDSTSHYLTCKSTDKFQEACDRLTIPAEVLIGLKKKKHRFVIKIFQQRLYVKGDGARCSPCYLPAKTLKKENGSVVWNAVDSVVPCINTASLKDLSNLDGDVLLAVVADTHGVNNGVSTKAAYDAPKLLVVPSRCDIHSATNCLSDAFEGYDFLNKSYSVHNTFGMGENQAKLLLAIGRLVDTMHVLDEPPPLEATPFREWLLDQTWCRFLSAEGVPSARLVKGIALYRKVFNGCLWRAQPVHYCCVGPDGTRCHENESEAKADAMACLSCLLADCFDPGKKPSDKDFFKLMDYLRCWVLLMITHRLGVRAVRMMFRGIGDDLDPEIREGDDLGSKAPAWANN